MMTGLANVNKAIQYYQAITATFLGMFAIYDILHHKVRNTALLCFLPWCLLSLPIYAQAAEHPFEFLAIKATLGFLNGGLILLMAALVTDGGIGGGDIKLTSLLGIICGTGRICFLLLAASITAILFLFFKKVIIGKREGNIPFVPFLLVGLLLSFL